MRALMWKLTGWWGLCQREFFGGRIVFSSPIGVYWYLWPVLVIEDGTYRAFGRHWAVSVHWLNRGLRVERKHPDAA